MPSFWDTYYRKPLEHIPWQHTQADWFTELVDNKHIGGETALDLGCGTGQKSIYLAKHGFRYVLGVDIAAQAISYARANAVAAGVSERCIFAVADLTAWTFAGADATFDFVLDWAAMHCLPEDALPTYAAHIAAVCAPGGRFLLRTFDTDDPQQRNFVETVDGISTHINLLTNVDLMRLFPDFHVVARNTSRPRTQTNYFFREALFQKEGGDR